MRMRVAAMLAAGMALASPSQAYLFWTNPQYKGAPVVGDEPDVVLVLPGATAKEKKANVLWTMRAGLNVAALQCQFAPVLRTVPNYNSLIKQHATELTGAMKTLEAYFTRIDKKNGKTAFDQYTTRTYNSFSTMHAQLSFCDVAADIGRTALDRRAGEFGDVAVARLREFRNSLVPVGDSALAYQQRQATVDYTLTEVCYDKKGREKRCKTKS